MDLGHWFRPIRHECPQTRSEPASQNQRLHASRSVGVSTRPADGALVRWQACGRLDGICATTPESLSNPATGLYGANTLAGFWGIPEAEVSLDRWQSAVNACIGLLPHTAPDVVASRGWEGLMEHILGESQFGPERYRRARRNAHTTSSGPTYRAWRPEWCAVFAAFGAIPPSRWAGRSRIVSHASCTRYLRTPPSNAPISARPHAPCCGPRPDRLLSFSRMTSSARVARVGCAAWLTWTSGTGSAAYSTSSARTIPLTSTWPPSCVAAASKLASMA